MVSTVANRLRGMRVPGSPESALRRARLQRRRNFRYDRDPGSERDRDRTRLLMELREGRNRQIRRMMAQLGHQVKKLRRVQMGPIKLKGLKPGQWRELMPRELVALKKAAHREETKKKTRKKARKK